jgi:uracil-DNA glycosylase
MPRSPTKAFDAARAEAAACTACDLWEDATGTVFGEGPVSAALVLIGETPGDREDREGRPFVGPAGRVLDDALEAAGIDRSTTYITNAVKHFKFVPTRNGHVRLHKTPNRAEIAACRKWWELELEIVRPSIVGLLGATAGRALLGPQFRVTTQRGQPFPLESGGMAIATIHPSAVLRAGHRRSDVYDGLVTDLKTIASHLAAAPGGH